MSNIKWEDRPTDIRFRKPKWVKNQEERERYVKENIKIQENPHIPKPLYLDRNGKPIRENKSDEYVDQKAETKTEGEKNE